MKLMGNPSQPHYTREYRETLLTKKGPVNHFLQTDFLTSNLGSNSAFSLKRDEIPKKSPSIIKFNENFYFKFLKPVSFHLKSLAFSSTFKPFTYTRFYFNSVIPSPYPVGKVSLRKSSRLRFFNNNFALSRYLSLPYPDYFKSTSAISIIPDLKISTKVSNFRDFNFTYMDNLVFFISPFNLLDRFNGYSKVFKKYNSYVFFLNLSLPYSKFTLKRKHLKFRYRTLGEKLYFYTNPRFLGKKPKIAQFRFLLGTRKYN